MTATAFSLIVITLALVVCITHRPKQRQVAELPTPSKDVLTLIVEGKNIAAIRDYRRATGASLLEASRVIEYYAAQHS